MKDTGMIVRLTTVLRMVYLYLHGFASGPLSSKAQYLRQHMQSCQIELQVLDLNQGNFSQLTLTRQLQQVAAALPPAPTPVTSIGSSFGGLTAAWAAQQHPQIQRLVLLAPAFQFLSHWLPKLGSEALQDWQAEQSREIYHYGEQRALPLHYDFVTDLHRYADRQLQRSLPTLILHGQQDEVIPIEASREFAATRPWVKLVELDSDHSLGTVLPAVWQQLCCFCQLTDSIPGS